MLKHYTDIDAHLDMLDNVDGHLFKLSALELTRFKSRPFFNRVERTILAGDKYHTLLVIEEPPRRWKREIHRKIEKLGKTVDGKKTHQIHVFFIPSEMFKIMVSELTDWD